MKYEVVFSISADEDLQLAFDWYENEKPGLGWEFRNEIALCIEQIMDDRVSYQVYLKDIRRIYVARFPYRIYYRKDEPHKKIVIAAILHDRRSPNEIKERIKVN